MNHAAKDSVKWNENVIIADADYIDRVAFDLTVNFERMLERRIPKADMARWLECIALDGGLREGDHGIHVVLVHDKQCVGMDNFLPGNFAEQLNGKAFRGPLGEFTIHAVTVEDLVTKENLLADTVRLVCEQAEVKRIMVIPDEETAYEPIKKVLREMAGDRQATVFSMQPMPGGNFKQEILGYSLMNALGIRADEIK